jgi:hypothetical protein
MAPNIQADLVRWSRGALGRVPRFAQRRVILVFCPTLASSFPTTTMAAAMDVALSRKVFKK